MASKKRVTSPDGRVLMKHKASGNTAWMSEKTIPHHRKAGWTLASESDDQPTPAGDPGTPAEGGSTDPKKENDA